MLKIFLSYRRNDVPQLAKQIYDGLIQHFPKDDVFMDVDTIPYGSNFLAQIERHIILANVVLVLVGPLYNGQPGERRLMNQDDFVRLELELAHRHQKRILPILVGAQTQFPPQTDLPPSLIDFPFLNALRFPAGILSQEDQDQLIAKIEPVKETPSGGQTFYENRFVRRWIGWISVGIGVVAIVPGVLISLHQNSDIVAAASPTAIFTSIVNIIVSIFVSRTIDNAKKRSISGIYRYIAIASAVVGFCSILLLSIVTISGIDVIYVIGILVYINSFVAFFVGFCAVLIVYDKIRRFLTL